MSNYHPSTDDVNQTAQFERPTAGWLMPDFRLLPCGLRDQAETAFQKGDALGLAWLFPSGSRVDFIRTNVATLKRRGIFESALLEAYNGCRRFPGRTAALFKEADRQKLLEYGDPLPAADRGYYTLYRGVAYPQVARGLSWTSDLPTAACFATTAVGFAGTAFGFLIQPAPAVYCARMPDTEIFATLTREGASGI